MLSFLPAFPMAYDMNAIDKGAAICLSHFFVKMQPVPLSVPENVKHSRVGPVQQEIKPLTVK